MPLQAQTMQWIHLSSEQISLRPQEAFQRGEVSSEAFVERYTALRKVFHQRDLKCQAARHTLITS